ncbi:hypothetical protein FOMPIDRAFT_1063172 [Fomitopsis schrenkii]|uniref:HTH APSES-type domain-containing protein n=1 Tax=Fomitopsis schrenkii TaxID=2126942 RepID=S8DPA4_FOMSC|nr:hypothetical protein FOMPIDRAFT_1063172 [Fomitopsis schrenkii]
MKQTGALERPPLPTQHLNPHLKHFDPAKPPQVKFQEIVRDGESTIVARLKIQTPSGHAFVLRRLDTGAISLTTMFRAAFPTATDDHEKAESNWIRATYDLTGTNKGGRSRFAGTWVTPDIALQLADSYRLGTVLPILAKAVPEPGVVYRRSTRAQQPTPEQSPAAAKEPGPAPAKKRREASPATPKIAPATPVAVEPVVPTPPPSTTRQTATPPPRRSTRHKSPAPPPAAPLPVRTPRSTRSRKVATPEPESVPEEAEAEPVAQAMAQDIMDEDIREQKALIARLKQERARRAAQEEGEEAEGEEEEEEEAHEVSPAKPASKRPREDEVLKFDFKEPTQEIGERAIATNRRVSLHMTPQRKSAAWGALAFAFALGAVNLYPTVQSYLSI